MHPIKPTSQPVLQAVGVVLGATLAVLLTTGAASATPSAPQLSIAVDNGRTSTAAGDRLVYTITVRNLGTADITGMEVTQSVPPGLEFESADPAEMPDLDTLSWGLDLKAAGEATFASTMTVSDTPADLLRLATVACAGTSVGGPPVVCASHSDQLPAGAAAEADRAAAMSPTGVWWYVGGGILVLGAGLVVLVIRRRTARHS